MLNCFNTFKDILDPVQTYYFIMYISKHGFRAIHTLSYKVVNKKAGNDEKLNCKKSK